MKKLVPTILLLLITFGIAKAQQQTDTLVVYFDIGKSVVDANNATALDEFMTNKNVVSIRIYGYTDFLGHATYNQQLSEERSRNVRNYLINKGINRASIVLSKGEGVHLNSCEENRRDPLDKGIQAHRMVRVVYTTELRNNESRGNSEEHNLMSHLSKDPTTASLETTAASHLSVENLVVNNRIVLENVLFLTDTDFLLPESYPALRELLTVMLIYPKLKIEIHGHICCAPEDSPAGEHLSHRRAMVVYYFLLRNHIHFSRMSYVGFGSSRKRFPLEQNEYEKAMNRRVEILILDI